MAQRIVVVEILVAERNRKHPLTDQRRDLVLDQILPPLVMEARGKSIHHADRSIRRSQQQPARFRRHQAGVKGGFHSAAFNHSKIKAFCATLCWHRWSFLNRIKSMRHNDLR